MTLALEVMALALVLALKLKSLVLALASMVMALALALALTLLALTPSLLICGFRWASAAVTESQSVIQCRFSDKQCMNWGPLKSGALGYNQLDPALNVWSGPTPVG